MNKPKVLLIQESLMSYRDPIYSLISKEVDLTVAYTIKADYKESDYPIISIPYKKIGEIIWHQGLRKIINKYDVVIFVPHFKMIRLAMLPFLPHKPKLVTWSIGVHVSYNREYNLSKPPSLSDRIYECIQNRADACIFYMKDPIEYWKKYKNINEKKYFVAHNTVVVAPFTELKPDKRNVILFVGTLYRQKGLEELITCYAKAKEKVGKMPPLKIIGKGPEQALIEQRIKELNLDHDIEMTGAIYDENILKEYFLRSIICVSPKQAGLTVLKSMGYGVPFVTRRNAITGGEKGNIIEGKTGCFYDTEEDLTYILSETSTNPQRFSLMSTIARKYYVENASPEKMAQGVVDALFFSLSNTR